MGILGQPIDDYLGQRLVENEPLYKSVVPKLGDPDHSEAKVQEPQSKIELDTIFEEQERQYNYLFARVVISVDLDQGTIPTPLSILRAPWKFVTHTLRAL